ncbi:MAG: hypothetical protein PWP60_234 [Candidatus Atribacteria bacterium]|uniref:Stage 0 sporulation family protein n=1 Tax=Thermatribacter velox TaxID=3039681 RepID=A0ABZ2YH63_9BACT|nr:hypothetical protein [Candidatus Atribacteria bacterium]
MRYKIGIKFYGNTKIYHFDARNLPINPGEKCVVETILGMEIGEAVTHLMPADQAENLKPVIRVATPTDLRQYELNTVKEREAFVIAQQKIQEYKLQMKLLKAHYTLDRSRLIFYFGAEGRIDFRQLVKDLASIFHTRIEMRQLGVRDEARIVGGCGICGREVCCSRFLSNFEPVSIKMAKEQNLVLNSAKISGLCGRLMCCLNFEYYLYKKLLHQLPRKGSKIITPLGEAKVIEVDVIHSAIHLELEDGKKVKIREEDYNRFFL